MPKDDYASMASAMFDLWQQNMSRAMQDTDFLQNMMANMQAGGVKHEQKPHRHTPDASGAGLEQLDALRQRVERLERKITKLEATIERLQKAEKKSNPARPKRSTPASASARKPAKRTATKTPKKKPAAKATTRKRAVKRKK